MTCIDLYMLSCTKANYRKPYIGNLSRAVCKGLENIWIAVKIQTPNALWVSDMKIVLSKVWSTGDEESLTTKF